MSLRATFLLVLTLILTVGVGTTGTVLIYQQARSLTSLLGEKQLLVVEHAAFGLQENLNHAARELARLARLPEFDPEDNDTDPERLLLYGAHENSLLFRVTRVLDRDGRVTLVQPAGAEDAGASFGDRHWFEAARRTHQPFFYPAPERASIPEGIAVVMPLWRDGHFEGAIQGLLDLGGDGAISSGLLHDAGPEGELVLVDREGRALFPPGAHPLGERGFGPALAGLQRGRAGTERVRGPAGDHLYAWAPVGIGGWGVMMRWPWLSLAGAVRQQVVSTVAILAVGVVLVGLVAIGFAAWLTRPLQQLGEVAQRLARGEEAGAPLPPSPRRDEVGSLMNAFHHMEGELQQRDARIREDLDTISRLNASLEERVRERTRELEAAQARLLEVERSAAMGITAAAIAHEVRNALNGLGMCVDLVLRDTPANAASLRVRAQIHHEIARLRDITESLLTFSRAPRLERAPVDVHALLQRALAVVSEQLAEGEVTVVRDLAGDGQPLLVDCDGYKLQGVIINLAKNAVEAMTTRPLDLADDAAPAQPRDRVLRVVTRTTGAAARIEIQDSGPGLLPAARAHLFEPFFTTKVTGTGLGLATARRIVEAHGGTIALADLGDATPPSEGTLATITLPLTPPA